MAEIEIEKKKPIWPWILLALIVAALIYFFAFADDDIDDGDLADDNTEMVEDDMYDEEDAYDDTYDTTDADDDTYANNENALSAYKTYIDNPEMGLDHEHANGALLKLIDAVEAKASMYNVDVAADLAEARNKAQDITKDPYEVDHANKIRHAGEVIVRALKSIHQEAFPKLTDSHKSVNMALMKIKPDEQTLNQKMDVKNFFNEAADLLTEMKK